MKHPSILDKKRTALALIDMQEAFRKAIPDFAELAERIALLVQACNVLGVPVIVTEQYPQGLKHTVAEIAGHFAPGTLPLEKTAFSACGAVEFDLQLRERHIEQVLLCGIEAHVCVSQTAHDLLQLGYQVHLLSDAIGARLPRNREVAIAKMTGNGALLSSVEMAIFELVGGVAAPEFKAIQAIVKQLR